MPRVGLVYEDEPQRMVVERIAQRILGANTHFVVRNGDGWPGIVGKLPGLLASLEPDHRAEALNKVLVIVDANGQDPLFREERLTRKVGNRGYVFGVPHCFAITRMCETWFVADPGAVLRAIGARIPAVHDPEGLLDPKRYLIEHLNNQGQSYRRDVARGIAEALNLDTVARHCPRFNVLRELLTDP